MGTFRTLESVSCSDAGILSTSESLVFRIGGVGLNIALQVYVSKRPGSEPLAWTMGSSPASRRMRAEKSKPRDQRNYPGAEEYVQLESLPCELIDTFDPRIVRDSIEWLRHYVETQGDRYVEGFWVDSAEGRGRPFDRRECAGGVFADLAAVYELAGRSIERGERILSSASL
jgi:hypothetical protein